jgi:hypothetical protein
MSKRLLGMNATHVVLIAALACSTAAGACGPDASFITENDLAMNRMMDAMNITPTGDVDADFVAMMVPHHQGAIDMAVVYLRYGKNERLRRLAQEIIITQKDEITAMRLAVGQPLAQTSRSPHSQSSGIQQHAVCPSDSSSMVHGSMHDHRNQ